MQKGNIIAAAGSLGALLIGTFFVFFYTAVKFNILEHDRSVGALPVPCLLFHSLTLPAFLVPIGFGAAFVFMSKRQRFDQQATAIFVTASCLFTLSWVLGCLLVWELPYVPLCSSL